MPAKNSIKQYLENGYYHIYNRGVEKRNIFLDKQDYSVFLGYLKEYLTEKNEKEYIDIISNSEIPWEQKNKAICLLNLNNFFNEISLLAFSLMLNHFHLLIKQNNLNSIDKFMNSLCTRYTMYFNKKYKRVGKLYQGVYKAVLVESNEQLLHLSRYIHRQAIFLKGVAFENFEKRQPSSYEDYLGIRDNDWVLPNEILSFFSKETPSLSYESFVKQEDDLDMINQIILEDIEE